MTPKISVIVAAYNAELFLERCLKSIAAQTLQDWECIIINDGSDDETGAIADAFVATDTRFRVFRQVNGGVSSARNHGLKEARGTWICFVDSDDELPETALYTYFADEKKNEVFDFYIGGYTILEESGGVKYAIDEKVHHTLNRDKAINLMYKPLHYQYLGYIAGKLFKRSIIEKAGIRFRQDIYFNEDRLFSTQYMCHCDLVCFFTESVYRYYENPNSAMSMLFKEFNSRFFTDLDAMILMKDNISTFSPANLENAKEGIASSYWLIQDMLNHFHANTPARLLSLHKKLWRNLPLKDYKRLIFTPMLRKLIRF